MNETMLLAADSATPFSVPDVVAKTKECPVCQARAFDDMRTCFNCMYQFGSNPALERKAAQEAREGSAELEEESGAEGEGDATAQPSEAPWMGSDVAAQGNATSKEKQSSSFCFPRTSMEEQVGPPPVAAVGTEAGESLFAEALVELHCFLGQFLLHHGIDLKEL